MCVAALLATAIFVSGCQPENPQGSLPGPRLILNRSVSDGQSVVFANGDEFECVNRNGVTSIQENLGELCDVYTWNHNTYLLAAYSGRALEFRSHQDFRVIHTFSKMHKFATFGGVIDAARKRLISIGVEEKYAEISDNDRPKGNGYNGTGSVRLWSLDGLEISQPYYINSVPVSISRDRFADTVAVISDGGGIYVFRSSNTGIECAAHGQIHTDEWIFPRIRISNDGSCIGVTSDEGVFFWKWKDRTPEVCSVGGVSDWSASSICFVNDSEAVCGNGNRVWRVDLCGPPRVFDEIRLEIMISDLCVGIYPEMVFVSGKAQGKDSYITTSLNLKTYECREVKQK